MKILYSRHAPLTPTEGKEEVTATEILKDTTLVAELETDDVEAGFKQMQGQFMDKEIRDRIQKLSDKGLVRHTSMSKGDLVVKDGTIYHCDSFGWTEFQPSLKDKLALKAKPAVDKARKVFG